MFNISDLTLHQSLPVFSAEKELRHRLTAMRKRRLHQMASRLAGGHMSTMTQPLTKAQLLERLRANPRFTEAKPGVAVIIVGARSSEGGAAAGALLEFVAKIKNEAER